MSPFETSRPAADLPDDSAPRLCSFLAQTLEPLGFAPTSNYRLFYYWTRRTETLRQRCGLQFGVASVELWYDVLLPSTPSFASWSPFFAAWSPAEVAAARRVLDRFQQASADFAPCRALPNRESLYGGIACNALNRKYYFELASPTLRRIVEEHIVPLFERRREALDLLNAYDAGTLAALENYPETPNARRFVPKTSDSALYFGPDPILNALNLGALRLQNGQNAEALALFEGTAANRRVKADVPFGLLEGLGDVLSRSDKLLRSGTFETPLDSPYRRAAREVALLGVDVAKQRIAAEGPGVPATRRPFVDDSTQPTQTSKPRRFKRPSFASPGVDEPEVARLFWLARFSNDEAKAAEAIRHLGKLASVSSIVVYEGASERRVIASETVAAGDAASPSYSPPVSLSPSTLPPTAAQTASAPALPNAASNAPENVRSAFATYKSDFRRRLEEVFAQRLEPLGFKKASRSPHWTRKGKTLSHYCRFLFWARCDMVAVSFGYSVLPCFACWDAAPQNAETQALLARFRKEKPRFQTAWTPLRSVFEAPSAAFDANLDWEIFSKDGELEPLVAAIDTLLRAEILPFFARFPETDALLREYDAGRLGHKIALGREAGPGREFVAAQNYYRAGNYVEALARFEAVPERFRDFHFNFDSASENDAFLLELARLGALSVRKKLESHPDDAVSLVKRRPATPIPEPLATALPHYDNKFQARRVYWARELAASASAPEAETATRALQIGAETLRTLQEKAAQVLEPLGFTQESSITWTRETATLRQRFCLEVHVADRECYFYARYYQKPDFSPWDAAPQDAETQATLARLQTLVEKHFANAYFAENKCCFDYSSPSGKTPERVSSEALLSAAEQRFAEIILPFFDRWRETLDVLNDTSLDDVQSRFEPRFIWDAAQTKFGYALALFQAGRYTESAKRFDALSKLKKKPDLTVYDDATWAAFQDAARLAADRARELAKTKKIKR